MEKYLIAIGIPVIAVIGIYVMEHPEYWWLIFAAPIALLRFLMKRTIDPKRKPIFKEEPESSHGTVKIEPESKRL